jgi:hypothetical protein
LLDGRKLFVDSSLIDADASNNSVLDTQSLKIHLRESYKKLEARLEEPHESSDTCRRYIKKNSRYILTTDPNAAIVNRGKPKLSYQVHRAVDERSEIITPIETTAGDVNQAHEMLPLLERHHCNTGRNADTVVADSKYGTIENISACYDLGVKVHMPNLRKASVKRKEKLQIFSEERFEYDPESDTYRCPAGNWLRPTRCTWGGKAEIMLLRRRFVRLATLESNAARTSRVERSSVICGKKNWTRCVKRVVQPRQGEISKPGSI